MISIHPSIESTVFDINKIEGITKPAKDTGISRQSRALEKRNPCRLKGRGDEPIQKLGPLREYNGFDHLSLDGLETDRSASGFCLGFLEVEFSPKVSRGGVRLREGEDVGDESPGKEATTIGELNEGKGSSRDQLTLF